jgi:hypothetical protein
MIKALLRFILFTIPAYFLCGTENIIFNDREIIATHYDFMYRTEEKLAKEVDTLENLLKKE